jgi:hypothetical protein
MDFLMASSDCRVAPRASSRPATFTQAMSKIRATAPDSTAMVRPYPFVVSSYSDVSHTRS